MELLTADERAEALNLINNALEAKGVNLVACAYEDSGFFFDVTLMKGYESRPIKETVKSEVVKRTERGWAGHFIAAHNCYFRRNTLLEYKDKKWIVSTVGDYHPPYHKNNCPDTIGYDRWYETMVFEGEMKSNGYIDANVEKEIFPKNDCGIWGRTWDEVLEKYPTPDNAANDMHERIVAEMIERIQEEEDKNEKDYPIDS